MRFFLYPPVPCNYWQPIIASKALSFPRKSSAQKRALGWERGHKNCRRFYAWHHFLRLSLWRNLLFRLKRIYTKKWFLAA